MAQFKEFKQIIVEHENRESVYEVISSILSDDQVQAIVSKMTAREKNHIEQLAMEFPFTESECSSIKKWLIV